MTLRASFRVAALYVDPHGPYPQLVADGAWFDGFEPDPDQLQLGLGPRAELRGRDARTFARDRPAVAHPPCGPWGKLAWRCHSQERSAAIHAVEVVRECGGILEHPVGSRLFEHFGIQTAPWTPERWLDAHGGYTLCLPQWDWGHRAEKGTILYVVGTDTLPPLLHRLEGEPYPVERMTHLERRLSPPALAWWLCSAASRCRPPGSTGEPDPSTELPSP